MASDMRLERLLALLICGVPVINTLSFGYDPQHELGPERWADEFESCGGHYQSPIDIEESLVTRVSLPPLTFFGIHELPFTGVLSNTGHTVMLKINGSDPIVVTGGPLNNNYTFEQLHFHWGPNDTVGSEDMINNQSFSMELHLVFYKSQYGSVEESMKHKDGLTVLGLFIEISDSDNKVFSELVDSLDKIEYPELKVDLPYLLPLEFMLPKDRHHYFTYNGSLTTPPCLEIVTWIEFKHPLYLSHKQVDSFRRVRSSSGYLTNNARPVQPLYGRPVFYNIGDSQKALGSITCTNSKLLSSLSFLIIFFNYILF